MNREQVFSELPLLAKLPTEDLRALASVARVQDYRAGVVIFRQGEAGDSLHAIVDGSVRISVVAPSGAETTIALLGAGECFGELAILDGRPRSANATAAVPTRTLIVTRGDFIRWLADKPQSALLLLETLSLRLRGSNEAFVDLAFFDLPHRLARRLLRLSVSQAGDARRGHQQRLPITQSSLASMLGVSRESVNKQLRIFARDGWLEVGRGWIALKEPESLRAFD